MDTTAIEDLSRRVRCLERSAGRWRLIALVALASAAVSSWGPSRAAPRSPTPIRPQDEADAPADAPADDPGAIIAAQRDLATRSLDRIEETLRRGAAEPRLSAAAFAFSYRLLGSELFLSLPDDAPRTLDPELYLAANLAPPSPDRLDAFEAHRDRMRRWEDLLRPLVRDRILSPLAFAELQSRRLEAEALLARERLRLDAAAPPDDDSPAPGEPW